MKSTLLRLVFLCIAGSSFSLHAQKPNPSVSKQWDQLLADAKKENKILLLDFYTEWCGPCKMMDKEVFPQAKVDQQMKAHYKMVKLNPEVDSLAKALQIRYGIDGYPTYLFMDGDLQVKGVISAYMDAETFATRLAAISTVKGIGVKGYTTTKWLDYPDFFLNRFNRTKEERMEQKQKMKGEDPELTAWLDQRKDLTDEASWNVMKLSTLPKKHQDYFLDHIQQYSTLYTVQATQSKAAWALWPLLNEALTKGDTLILKEVMNKTEKYFEDPFQQQIVYLMNVRRENTEMLRFKINFYDNNNVSIEQRMQEAMMMLMDKKTKSDTYIDQRCLAWAREAYEQMPENATTIAVYGAALYKNNKQEQGKALVMKAKAMNPEDEITKLFLETWMKANNITS